MKDEIALLQKRVYRLDFIIGNIAQELRDFSPGNTIFDFDKNLVDYEKYNNERATILDCIGKLSPYA